MYYVRQSIFFPEFFLKSFQKIRFRNALLFLKLYGKIFLCTLYSNTNKIFKLSFKRNKIFTCSWHLVFFYLFYLYTYVDISLFNQEHFFLLENNIIRIYYLFTFLTTKNVWNAKVELLYSFYNIQYKSCYFFSSHTLKGGFLFCFSGLNQRFISQFFTKKICNIDFYQFDLIIKRYIWIVNLFKITSQLKLGN